MEVFGEKYGRKKATLEEKQKYCSTQQEMAIDCINMLKTKGKFHVSNLTVSHHHTSNHSIKENFSIYENKKHNNIAKYNIFEIYK